MMQKSKLALVALLAGTTIASPALARSHTSGSFDAVAPLGSTMTVSPVGFSSRMSGTMLRTDSPAATGGGSVGYNQAQDNPNQG